jgi:hypothetical protein
MHSRSTSGACVQGGVAQDANPLGDQVPMSVKLCVFLLAESLPSHSAWQFALDRSELDLKLDPISTREHAGFVPTVLNGAECGFEYYFDELSPEESAEVRSAIGARNRVITLRTVGGRENDLRAAELAAAMIAELSDGVFYDPQSGDLVQANGVLEWLRLQEIAERDRRMQEAQRKWSKTTNRRCPKCNAPCPDYRATCWVCRFEIGRE